MCIEIQPKHAVASVIGFIKGKSAIAIAREFGGKVAFCGGISDQALVDYTPAEVKDEVHRTIDSMGKAFGNAYIVAPSNAVPPDLPLENLEALFEACHHQ